MAAWQNFFLQRMGTDGNGDSYPVCESVATWGIFCKDIPFKLFEKVKEPAKRSWPDEDGDDEYIPADGLKLEAYSIKVEFGCKKLDSSNATKYGTSTITDVRANVGTFLNHLKSGLFKLYSSYTRIGRQNVRLESVSDSAKWKSDENGEFLIFEVTFKVNDPVTDITLS
jgi:hypothetical protein